MTTIKEKLSRGINPPNMLQSMASGYRREALAEIERLEKVIDELRAENKRLALIVSNPSDIDPTSLRVMLSHNYKLLYRVISSSELRQFKNPRKYVSDAAADLVSVFFSGDETMTETTP